MIDCVFKQALISLGFVGLLSFSSHVIATERPNIVVIFADDLGYGDLGYTGSKEIFTPNIDSLANNGVIFKNGYVTHPYCGPSRAGLLTGRHQARFGMEVNAAHSPDDPYMGLPLEQKTFAKRLQKQGYQTAVIGKWHVGSHPNFHPNNRGFDYFYGFLPDGHNYFPESVKVSSNPYDAPLVRNGKPAQLEEYLTTALSRDAARYIKNSGEQPFMLYLAYNAPHSPIQALEEDIAKYSHISDLKRRTYAAMIDSMDQGVGRVIDALKQADKFDNTLIFFLSDNGGVYPEDWWPQQNWARNTPFRRGKVALTEGGIHVPFIAHWPKGFSNAMEFDGLVSSLDIAATSLALSGADIATMPLDGVDLTPYIQGKLQGSPHKALYWRLEEADHLWAVRTPQYKYLHQPLLTVGKSFFDMQDDPYEAHNLYGQKPELQRELAELWNEWNADNKANVLLQNVHYLKRRKAFYQGLYNELVDKAAVRPTYTVE
ncbi:sulfatase-like hydrolase/transferase [Paraglaciecola aquimarina]|uniref:Sulfatase-like hydrolase/transferase n=1 Tax=Paraglaciecola aquimarina TaxID=1235557 RepID=A0ABU3SYA0_9ALTE|nr:sulfatase-like hydrolase/transferase [Paraglaciecola aquimarina]MDU0354897.1 sulfatase-like hydrolase/transferase [Paraglaciecola aquimarina]